MENQWEGLKCACGSEEFVTVVGLRWRASGGIVSQSKGYRCANCRKIAPIDRMIRELKERQLESKIEELKQEQANATPPRDKVSAKEEQSAAAGVRAG